MSTSTSTTVHPSTTTSPAARPGRRPPGLFAAKHLWVFYVIGCLGMGLDATLAAPVVGVTFDLHPLVTYGIVLAFGLIAAKAASEAAVSINRGSRAGGIAMLVFVGIVGVSLAVLRWYGGVAPSTINPADFAQGAVEEHNEWPATLFMLALYFASAFAVFLTAQKLFVQARVDLERHDRAKRKALRELADLEADYSVIHEHIAGRPERRQILDNLLTQALEQLKAREPYLKAYARDAIARAVGRPDATPLVRAPHEPAKRPEPLVSTD